MRIISKHRDYYDSVQAYGSDPKCFYKRIRKEIDKNTPEFNNLSKNPIIKDFIENLPNVSGSMSMWDTAPIFSNQFILFFCGKIYPCFIYEYKKNKKYYNEPVSTYFYHYTDLLNFILKKGTKKQKEYWFKKQKYMWWNNPAKKAIPDTFEKALKYSDNNQLIELHHDLGIPYFLYTGNQFIMNPILSSIKFYKIFDTYRAHQEISMFISGILGGQSPPMIKISDKCRKEMHGFDKWSFRKEPTKR